MSVRMGSTALSLAGAGTAIVLARFIPLTRTVLNPLAGTFGAPARIFSDRAAAAFCGWSEAPIIPSIVMVSPSRG